MWMSDNPPNNEFNPPENTKMNLQQSHWHSMRSSWASFLIFFWLIFLLGETQHTKMGCQKHSFFQGMDLTWQCQKSLCPGTHYLVLFVKKKKKEKKNFFNILTWSYIQWRRSSNIEFVLRLTDIYIITMGKMETLVAVGNPLLYWILQFHQNQWNHHSP